MRLLYGSVPVGLAGYDAVRAVVAVRLTCQKQMTFSSFVCPFSISMRRKQLFPKLTIALLTLHLLVTDVFLRRCLAFIRGAGSVAVGAAGRAVAERRLRVPSSTPLCWV